MSRQIFYDLIVAKSLNNGIGKNNTLPWKLKPDLALFKKITTYNTIPNALNTIIMGRKTF